MLPSEAHVDSTKRPCSRTDCLAYELCCSVDANPKAGPSQNRYFDTSQSEPSGRIQAAPAGQIIVQPKEWHDFIPIICCGWAAYSMITPDGRRQILSFLLMGDLVSIAWRDKTVSDRLVQTVTPVIYRKFRRSTLESMLLEMPDLQKKHLKIWTDELARAEQLAFILGRCKADQRIARLILDLSAKLASLGMMQGQVMEFPLRQRDIADATGLTPDHVSKLLVAFRRADLIRIDDRTLTIIKPEELASLA